MTKKILKNGNEIEKLYAKVSGHVRIARQAIIRSIDIEQLKAYWLIGRDIVEEEQLGKRRAGYGTALIEEISIRLTKEFGKGLGLTTIKDMRRFYLVFSKNRHAVRDESYLPTFQLNLGWTHYRSLMRINNQAARLFYEIEAGKNNWSSRELDRQIGSLLYERLALSKDKKGLLALAQKGQEIKKPEDAIKSPYVMEFLGLPESHKIIESKLEQALIDHLQKFLLELGRGFAFISRQQRLTLDNHHFYVDLVFYHTILKRYILIDLKTKPLTHADLGQMRLYRNYYDMECLTEGDSPTIGLILCTEKSNKMVKYFLKDDDKIFASKYKLNLPTEKELEVEIREEIKVFKQGKFKV